MVDGRGTTARRLRTSRKLPAPDKGTEHDAGGVTTRARSSSKPGRRSPALFPLLSLPAAILQEIATLAGPSSRQLCKELRAAYGSFPTLRPFSILTTRALLHALSTLSHPRLQSLDLSRIAPLVTARTLPALCTAFPHLRSLQLCYCWKLSDDAIAALAPLRVSLTHLDISSCSGLSPAALVPLCNLTALRHLKLELRFREFPFNNPVHSAGLRARTAEHLAPVLRLGRLTALDLWLPYTEGAQAGAIAATTALPHLVALTLYHQPYSYPCDDVLQELSCHSGLTSLQLHSSFCIDISRPSLRRVAALTGLRRLQMHACVKQAGGGGAADGAHEWGALAALSRLQALELHADTKRSDVFDVVLESVTALSGLAELTLCGKGPRSDAISDKGLQRLPAIAPALTALHLANVFLPPAYLTMLLPLTALRELRLAYLWSSAPAPPDYALLGSLRSLRHLVLRLGPSAEGVLAPGAVLGEQVASLALLPGLTNLEVSACQLTDDDLAHFTRLTRLRQLNLSFNTRLEGPGLRHLRQLPLLEELEVMVHARVLTNLLPLPPRLGVCMLRLGCGNRGGHEAVGGSLGPACRVVVLDPLVGRHHRRYGL